jgi:hypothetical protein
MGDQGMVMGDLVLTMDEVAPVMTKLAAGGIEVTALHNHLLRNQPFTMYMHVQGNGDPVKLAAPQMIKYPGLFGEPGGGPGIAGIEPPPRLDRVESFFVAAVEAQPNAKIKMSDSEVSVELDRAVRVRYCSPDISSPMACLGEHILGLRVFTIESESLKGGFACLTDEWSEVLDRPVIPLHDQRPGKPKMGVREVGIERKRVFEQAIGCRPIGAGGLVHIP